MSALRRCTRYSNRKYASNFFLLLNIRFCNLTRYFTGLFLLQKICLILYQVLLYSLTKLYITKLFCFIVQKITGKDLQYRALIGKPCEITYRYAEHVICDVAKRLGIQNPIRKLYFVGDNPNVDIVGANLYDRYLTRAWLNKDNGNFVSDPECTLPLSRSIPSNVILNEQTVRSMESVLVGTGVFNPNKETGHEEDDVYHGHRDILHEPQLAKPSRYGFLSPKTTHTHTYTIYNC